MNNETPAETIDRLGELVALVESQAQRIESLQAANAELQEEIATLRTYCEETGKVLLDEIDDTSANTMSVVEAATVLTRHMINREDSFAVSSAMTFEAEGDAEAEPQRYDLIIQKAGAQTLQENLDACKAENATLRATKASDDAVSNKCTVKLLARIQEIADERDDLRATAELAWRALHYYVLAQSRISEQWFKADDATKHQLLKDLYFCEACGREAMNALRANAPHPATNPPTNPGSGR